MTEIEELTGSTALAIAASVGLQTAYHLYQGIPNALVGGAVFLLFACFLPPSRRTPPVTPAPVCGALLFALRHICRRRPAPPLPPASSRPGTRPETFRAHSAYFPLTIDKSGRKILLSIV